jgi:hypothetical protein
MDNISNHMRISGVSVTDADVESRRSAATNLASNWGKVKDAATIVSKAAEVAKVLGGDGIPSRVLGDEVQGAIQKKSPAYLFEERPLDVSVCAGTAMLCILNNPPKTSFWTADIYAAALWSALGYQPVLETEERRENLRREVLNAAT